MREKPSSVPVEYTLKQMLIKSKTVYVYKRIIISEDNRCIYILTLYPVHPLLLL
jgi:hypothetical protein